MMQKVIESSKDILKSHFIRKLDVNCHEEGGNKVNEKRTQYKGQPYTENDNKEIRKNVRNLVVVQQQTKSNLKKSGTLALDKINLGIIELLFCDGDMKSSEIAAKLKVPLSTIQRRRSNLEKDNILKKNYYIDLKRLGLRTAEISIATNNGEGQNILDTFFNKHKRNIIDMSLRIGNPDTNVSFRVAYTDSQELFNLLEEIKEIETVSMVHWSEYITEKKNQTASISGLLSS